MVFLRTHQPYSGTGVLMETKLERIAEISASSPRPEFTSLYHLINKETVMKKSKWFMIPFCVIIFVALILIISIWNHVTDFKTAYFQSFLFLVIMNWFDGIVIDRLWVGHSKIWHIEGMEDVSYVKSWKTVLIKRGAATVVYMLVALVVAGIVVLISKI